MSANQIRLHSMTGFARTDGNHESSRWTWEIKSVNGRGLEVRFRMPHGFDFLEPALRARVSAFMKRGSVNASLNLKAGSAPMQLQLNEQALAQVLPMLDTLAKKIDCEKPRPESILNIRGVVDQVDHEPDADAQANLGKAIAASFDQAVELLNATRVSEGAAMASVLSAQFDEIEKLTNAARQEDSASPTAIRDRLKAQIENLLADGTMDESRLAQEAALLAVKADIREELDRLDAHIEAARELLVQGGAVGRKLDFLSQEFNREANTLCSKAPSMSLKRIGLDLKAVIDQMREQIQNVE